MRKYFISNYFIGFAVGLRKDCNDESKFWR